jgi:hypothetical protein
MAICQSTSSPAMSRSGRSRTSIFEVTVRGFSFNAKIFYLIAMRPLRS